MYLNTPGIPITAVYSAPNAVVAPSVSDLAACGASTNMGNSLATSVQLIEPFTTFEDRLSKFDIRLSKNDIRAGRLRIQPRVDVYNVFNASTVHGNDHHIRTHLPSSAFDSGRAVREDRRYRWTSDLTDGGGRRAPRHGFWVAATSAGTRSADRRARAFPGTSRRCCQFDPLLTQATQRDVGEDTLLRRSILAMLAPAGVPCCASHASDAAVGRTTHGGCGRGGHRAGFTTCA